jgi:hypothetical protein
MVLGWYQIELAQANLVGTGLDPSEPNNSVLQTTPLNLGTPPSSITAEHALPIASDFDFYAPTWTGVGDLTISVSVPQNTLGYLPDLPSQAVYLQVWDGNQVTIGRVCQSMRNPDGTTAPPAGLALTNAPQGMFFSVRAVTGCVDATTPSASSGYLGSYTLTVTVTPPSGPTIRQWVGGDPAGPSDWDNGNNWSPVGVPSAQDSVVIPAGAVTMPVLDANAEIGRIEVLPQATLSLAGYTMTVWEDVLSGGQLLGPGTVTIAGSGSTAAGSLPSVLVTGGADLVGPVTVSGVLTVRGGFLNEKGFPLVIRGAVP